MDEARVAAAGQWVTETGLAGAAETELLDGYCRRVAEAGLPLARATVLIDTLHPVHEGRVFRWRRGEAQPAPGMAYGRTSEPGEAADGWRRSPFFRRRRTARARFAAGWAPRPAPSSPSWPNSGPTGRPTISP